MHLLNRHHTHHTHLLLHRSFFTAAEKAKLTNIYGTITQRLGGDSMRAFDACHLCLHAARTPVVCGQGHLSCRECSLTNLLAQKQAITLQERKRAALLAEQEAAEQRGAEGRKRKEVEAFERNDKVARHDGRVAAGTGPASPPAEGDQAETVDARNKRAFGRSSFWIPCQAPESKEAIAPPPSREVFCTASATPHPVTLKKLYPVLFTRDRGAAAEAGAGGRTKEEERGEDDAAAAIICPACSKALHNGSRITVVRTCGHAFCTPCATTFIQAACTVCEVPCRPAKGDLIPLHSEGTGFAGSGGLLLTKRETYAFQ